ncbi:unnamed protein product [Sphagnum troendelagicum]|uniref:Uncharacterized protein n=1 Tax=Sphagnum troendelagicum TaxID=128251 RepID=A0ABP0TWM4_9BRYO
MSFFQDLEGLASGGGNNTNTQAPGTTDASGNDPNTQQLLSSSEALLNAARGQGNVSNAQLADDAGTLLQGVDNYAKLNNTPYGNYFQDAAGYLQKFGGGSGADGDPATGAPAPTGGNTKTPPATGGGAAADPNANYSDPSQNAADPNSNYSDPSKNAGDPNSNYSNPSQNAADLNANYSDPSGQSTRDQYSDPNASGGADQSSSW